MGSYTWRSTNFSYAVVYSTQLSVLHSESRRRMTVPPGCGVAAAARTESPAAPCPLWSVFFAHPAATAHRAKIVIRPAPRRMIEPPVSSPRSGGDRALPVGQCSTRRAGRRTRKRPARASLTGCQISGKEIRKKRKNGVRGLAALRPPSLYAILLHRVTGLPGEIQLNPVGVLPRSSHRSQLHTLRTRR